VPPRLFGNHLGDDRASPIPPPALSPQRAGWAVRHTLIALAALTLVAVGSHWWRTRTRPKATTVPPALQFGSHLGSLAALVFSRAGDEIYVAASSEVKVYDPYTGQMKRSWQTGLDWITHLSLSDDGKVAMTAGYQFTTGTTSGAIKLWNLHESGDPPSEITAIAGNATYPSAVALSPDATLLAYAWQPITGAVPANQIAIFDIAEETEKFTCSGHTSTVNSLVFSPDGKALVSAAWDAAVLKWDMETGQRATSGQASDFQMNGEVATYAPDGSRVAIGSGKGFGICDAATGLVLATGGVPADSVQAIALSPDGTLLAAAGNTYSGPTSFFGPLLGGKNVGTAGIWDAATGKLVVLLVENGPGIHSLCFSPDGKRIAVGDEDGVISIWNVDDVLRGVEP
jgi:WD40 repeat protein